jgi:hypothetical protein
MEDTVVARCAGVCAVIGGAAWTAAGVIHASQPRGCVGDECSAWQMREATTGTSLLVALAGVMLVASLAGLVLLVRRHGRLGRMGVVGATFCGVGVVVLGLAAALQQFVFGVDFRWMPAFVLPGVAALVVGLALVAATVLRSRILPSWVGAGLLIGAVLLVGANEQTAAILLAVPFGLALLAAGATLLLRQPEAVAATPTALAAEGVTYQPTDRHTP